MPIKRIAGVIGVLAVVALTVGGVVHAQTRSSLCRTAEPASWKAAARAHPRYSWSVPAVAAAWGAGARFAAFADGTIVVNRFAPGGAETLITVSPSGESAPLWTVPAHQSVDTLQARGQWAIVTTVDTRNVANPSNRHAATVAVDVHTRAATVIAGAGAPVTGVRAGFDPRAQRSFDVDRTGRLWYLTGRGLRPTLHGYDLGTGHRVEIGLAPSGQPTAPQLAVAVDGVYWNYLDKFGTTVIRSTRAVSLPVPAVVSTHHRHWTADDLATDGRSYAWTSGRTTSWWQPGMPAPKQVNLADADDHTIRVETVAGPLVIALSGPEADWSTVIDMRSHAYVINPRFAVDTRYAYFATTPNRVYTLIASPNRSATVYEIASAMPQLHC